MLVAVLAPLLAPLPGINDRRTDIDIMTGRVRQMYKLWFVPLWWTTKDSELTKALNPEDVRGVKPKWETVYVYPCALPVRNMHINTKYHFAINQVRRLHDFWCKMENDEILTGEPLDAFKRKTANDVLLLWQVSGSYFMGYPFLSALHEMFLNWEENENEARLDVFLALKVAEMEVVDGKTFKTFYYPDGKLLDRWPYKKQ